MTNPIDYRSPLALAQAFRDDPEGALAGLPGLGPERRVLEHVLHQSREPEMAPALAGFARSEEFQGCDGPHRGMLLEALTLDATLQTVGRMVLLAGDPEFRCMSPREALAQIRATTDGGVPVSARQLVERAGLRRPEEHLGAALALDLGLHAIDIVSDPILESTVVHATTDAWIAAGMEAGTPVWPIAIEASAVGTAIAGLIPLAATAAGVYGTLHEIAEAHEQGERRRATSELGEGLARTLSAFARGEESSGVVRGQRARGAAVAERLWEGLEPSQRVWIREHAPAFIAELRLSIERR